MELEICFRYRYLMRFILLFSYIIPISLRVNLDMAKLFYSWQIGRDRNIKGYKIYVFLFFTLKKRYPVGCLYFFKFIDTVVRSSTIPEELGRISFLLSDKTGTLTMNEMRFKKIHLGTVAFSSDAFEVSCFLFCFIETDVDILYMIELRSDYE